MTLAETLRSRGINVTEEDGYGAVFGCTTNGKRFAIDRACGAYGQQFSLQIEGNNPVTHCLIRTAIAKIKKN